MAKSSSCYPFLMILFLSQKLLAQPICPQSFPCQALGHLSFPFYTPNHSDNCGLLKVDCRKPTPILQLGSDGQSYEVLRALTPDIFEIHDMVFGSQLHERRCDSFQSLTLPNTPSISYTIFTNFTLLKCIKTPDVPYEVNNYFKELRKYYRRYNACDLYDFYYTYPGNLPPSSSNILPLNCSVIVLPASSKSNPNLDDLFTLLSPDFNLGIQLSSECLQCHDSGGQCVNDHQAFCLNINREFRKSPLIIKTALATIGIGGAVLLALLAFYFRQKLAVLAKSMIWRNAGENYINMETFINNHESLAPKRYSYPDVKKMTGSFKLKLGQGGCGSVYSGKLADGKLVAVKVLTESKGNGEEFINELASISKTSHVNVVSLLGFCFEGRHRALIYEFMPNGSLEKFIYNQSPLTNGYLGWEKLYKIAIGIARGLEYLHRGCNTQILHFDIKPHNILLDADFCPKIADFGFAKLSLGRQSVVSMSGMRGTPGYIAPEVFSRNFGAVSHKSDVYSYGMMVLEMVGGRRNHEVRVEHTSGMYFPHWIYKRVDDEDIGMKDLIDEEENEMARKMIIVSLWCIQTDPLSRPSITRVLDMLEGSFENLQVPPKPFLFSPSSS